MNLHSKYNPQAEASRFVDAISINGSPDYIVITEPAQSYLAKPLRNRFPHSRLIAIRYSDSYFLSTDSFWDYVYRPVDGSLQSFLLNVIGDEFLSNTLFLSWKASDNYWAEVASYTWKCINETLEVFKSLMYTRTAFGTVWLKNFFNNLLFLENVYKAIFVDTDFFFIAAGFSLEKNFDLLLHHCGASLCAGSAYNAVKYKNLPVSACITTDGTFWAKRHLHHLQSEVPLVFSLEAGVPKKVLEKNPLVLLSYNSELEKYFFDKFKLPFIIAKRNGTVSGTAVELLLENTKKNIYCCGLDLKTGKGFSHARPHSSLSLIKNSTSRLQSLENILTPQSFSSGSLKTYADWFSSLKQEKAFRVFRLRTNLPQAPLPNIKTVSNEDLNSKKFTKAEDAIKFIPSSPPNQLQRKKVLLDFFQNIKKQIVSSSLEKIIYSKEKTYLLLKEIVEFTAYPKLINFVKTKKVEDEKAVKDLCVAELEKLDRFFR
ncbi:MAG: DUF115 domain-containing protein [Treponemataceae bacterium]